jgi:hypothetical protein
LVVVFTCVISACHGCNLVVFVFTCVISTCHGCNLVVVIFTCVISTYHHCIYMCNKYLSPLFTCVISATTKVCEFDSCLFRSAWYNIMWCNFSVNPSIKKNGFFLSCIYNFDDLSAWDFTWRYQ